MSGLEYFAIYKSIRLHFNSETYDCFKYAFKAGSTTQQSFEIRKDKYCFVRLSRNYTRDEYIQFLAANFFEKPTIYSRELLQQSCHETYTKRRTVQESLSYSFQKDLEFLFADRRTDPNQLLFIEDVYPPLLQYVWSQDIEIETLIVLNHLLNFFPTWEQKIQDDIHWPKFYLRVKKYTPFLSFDGSTMKKIVKTVLDNTK